MRKLLFAALAAMPLCGVAHAQPADDDAPPPPPPMHGPAGEMRHGPMGPRHNRANELVAPAEDRKLTAADVQKIAEAYLLWNGNRAWKVTNVAEGADNTIGFAYSSAGGDVIARFKMDRRTGHIDRVS